MKEPSSPTNELSRWTIHGERLIDDTRRLRLSIAEVELPDGTSFEQYVMRMPRAAIVIVLRGDQVLMMWRHRFVIDRWVWELPGGYIDTDEEPSVAALREVEEETGWRPESIELLMKVQPNVASADAENLIYVARNATHVGATDINEAERVEWIGLDTVLDRIATGEIVGSSSVAGLLRVLVMRSESGA